MALQAEEPTTVREVFEHIVQSAGIPLQLCTDARAEFKGPSEDFLEEEKVERAVADRATRTPRRSTSFR